MIAGIIIALLTFAAAAVAIVPKLMAPKPHWEKIPLSGGAQYESAPHVDPKHLSEAFFKARSLLWEKTTFPPSQVNSVCQSLSIRVMPVDSWTNEFGQKVGGDTRLPFCPTVGKDLSSLLHEMVHCVEYQADGAFDNGHVKWEARGVWVADNEYRAWLQSYLRS